MKILGYYVDLEAFLPVLVLASQEERKTSHYPRKVACESVLQEIKVSNTWATCRMLVVEGYSILQSSSNKSSQLGLLGDSPCPYSPIFIESSNVGWVEDDCRVIESCRSSLGDFKIGLAWEME
jgi:hypothetical protein